MTVEPIPEPIEFDFYILNDKIAFVIDDHHLPFSANQTGKKLAHIEFSYEESFSSQTNHASYTFRLENHDMDKKTAFSIPICPVGILYNGKYSAACHIIKISTIEKGCISPATKSTSAYILSRSLCSLSMERKSPLFSKELEQVIISTGAGVLEFKSRFSALYSVTRSTIPLILREKPISGYLMPKGCPFCAKFAQSIRF